ncbi:hypothetical protein CONPUDRAFT_85678 [Coniophora puteana RWD-64-598 SS2]|uniref:DUF6534 domain-containing protein n=1 Tax=Coniophora puteana (strain RWD-64-598) TaxID=741705 RepID=A0A5M3M6N0_CONPW|nr:uncharacterized protein CONPUDRAFT_85678 [Coniophora puteana RWD-64-598 SS2]EIW74999.1 hypothetical protein CONPUDRAFT_85678 [Coniophora puteana RWD-64-598 SS2]
MASSNSACQFVPSAESVAGIVGPIEVGVQISNVLYGLSVIQTFVYFAHFGKDPWPTRAVIVTMMGLETLHQGFIGVNLWDMTVLAFQNQFALDTISQASAAVVIISVLIIVIVEGFFCYRLWRLSKNPVIPLLCILLSLIGSISAIILAHQGLTDPCNASYHYKLQTTLIILMLAAHAICDVTITLGLVYYLVRFSSFGMRKTNTRLHRLIVWSVETGMLTSIMATLSIIFFLIWQKNYAWRGIFGILANVECNSLLAALNNRLLLMKSTSMQELSHELPVYSQSGSRPPIPAQDPIVISVNQITQRDLSDEMHTDRAAYLDYK